MKITELQPTSTQETSTIDSPFRKVQVIGKGKRFLQYMIDMLCIYGFIYLMLFGITSVIEMMEEDLFEYLTSPYFGIWPASIFVLYFFLFELLFQQTPGKMIVKSYVIDEYGNTPSKVTLLLRTLIRFVPFEPISCFNDRGWHDQWTKTYVVPKEEWKELNRLMKEQSQTSPLS